MSIVTIMNLSPLFFRNFDIDRIVVDIERHYEKKIIAGNTLLIFDEIQEVRNGIASLKYFYENMRHVLYE